MPTEIIPRPQEIAFTGHKGSEHKGFRVLAGEGAPTLTGGWLKLAKVQRFQRVSLTVPEGFDPLVLTVPIMFDEVSQARQEGKLGYPNNETRIKYLEWMAGRPAHQTEITGEPPYVEVSSVLANGHQSNLVPTQFQTVPGSSQQWYITQITFDTNPLRDSGGERVRQAATVELTEILLSVGALSRARRERDENQNKFRTFKVGGGVNTIRKIAAAEKHPGSWKAILEANPKLGNNPDKRLNGKTKVRIPETIFQQAPR